MKSVSTIYLLMATLLGVCESQYISINPKPPKMNPCENASNTALIEHFFNIIFTEFHNTPPACVCIQMCPEQPTYCYPNGCLRRHERKNREETKFVVNSVNKGQYEGTTKSSMFLVDNHKDIMDNLLEGPGLRSYIEKTEIPQLKDLIFRPNPFKDLVSRYRKPSKLEIKYNLREQVKNTKTDKLNREKIDISKTRWPLNKLLLHGKQPFNRLRHYKKNDENIRQSKFFISMFPEYGPANYTPIFYNKYLTKRENNDGINVEALYLYKTDIANFSLEKLIDNLIESSLDKSKNDSKYNHLNMKVDDPIHVKVITVPNKDFTTINYVTDEDKLTTTNINNNAVSIFSINSTHENIDVNKYIHDTNTTNQNTFLEMIASMSKEIEKQNNASLELMERVTGKRLIISNNVSTTTIDETTQNNSNAVNFDITKCCSAIIPTTTTTSDLEKFSTTQKPVAVTPNSIYMKSKQRIVRKIKHRKIN